MKLRNTLALAVAVAAAMLAGAAVPSVTFAAPAAGAQQGDHPARGPGMRGLEAIENAANSDTVKLDDEQKSKVHSIIEDAMAQAKTMRQDAKAAAGADKSKDDKKDNRDKMIELVAQTKDRVEAVLTDAQKTAFRAALKVERDKMKDARGDRANGDKSNGDKSAGDKPAGKKADGDKKPA